MNCYFRGNNAASFVTVFHQISGFNRSRQVVIPSRELFRIFYAPETKLVGDLLSGPWKLPKMHEQIGLRNGLTSDAAWSVGNLVMTGFRTDCAFQLIEAFPRNRRL